ncbi:PAS domain S-box protein [Haloplanus litoreus]|uniref:PAS domain S-box protein n=1 Tax=Haloplanus litoreus TaxID=767515 RepID=UPI00361A36C3
MSSAPSLTEVQEVFEALGPPGTPFTTTEVATRFECTDRTIYNRLETLVEDGVLETKKVGARGRIWWRPVEGDGENERNTEETYQKLFESTNEGLCIIEVLFDADEQPVDYRFLETNPAFDELTGLRDAAGKRIRELDVDHNDYWIEKYGAVAQTGDPIQFTEYTEHLGEQWYEINAFRIGDPTEHTVAVLFDDITENKHAENAVDEGEKRLEALLEATTEGVYRISPDWSEIYQLAGENFIADDSPNTWQEYIPEDDRERVGKAIEEAIETQSPFELEHRITRADGTIGWVGSRAVPIVEDGEIVEWVGTATDITERKEQQREKDLLWQAIEKANSPLIMAEPGEDDNPIVYANQAFEQLSGYTESEPLGQDCRLLQGENTREEPVRELRETIDNEEQVTVELRNYRKDGTEFWNRVTIAPVYGTDGELVRFVGTQEDVTERKEQERKRKRVIDRVTDGIFETDADSRFTFVSEQAEALLDTSEAELVGRYIWNMFEDARETAFENRYCEVMETREPTSFVEYYSGLDSWFDVQAYPNDDGGVAVYFRDVTERKEREQARQRAEKRYQKLLELAPVPIFAVDPVTEKILEANEAVGDLIGCSVDDLIGRTRESVHPTEKSDGYDTIFRNATERGGTWRHLPDGSPTYIVTDHGEKITVEITAKRVEVEGHEVVYGVLQDISDQLEYQHRLDALNEVTHELFDAEIEHEVTRTAVEALSDVLETTTVAFYVFDEDECELGPVVHTTSGEEAEDIDELPVFEPGVGVEWRAFTDEQTALVDDFRTRETDYEFDRTVRSELAVPIGDWGFSSWAIPNRIFSPTGQSAS